MRSPHLIRGPRPQKELGQHFLQDEEIGMQIVRALDLRWEDRALEIGPGRGVLLRFLLKASHQVTAIELDWRLKKSLERAFGGHPGLNLVFDDFLKFDLPGYLAADPAPVKIVGNIPYSLSSPILFRLFETVESLQAQGSFPLKSAVLMLQKEVAERLCADPGGRAYGTITVFRALMADARLLFKVPAAVFLPPPKVTSAVVRLDFFPEQRYQLGDPTLFRQLVHHLFAQRRKMLKNRLASFLEKWSDNRSPAALPNLKLPADFDLSRRPEELSVQEFIDLYHLISPRR